MTITKHVVAQNTLTSGGIGIGIEESADLGIVVSALEIIESGIGVVDVTTIPQGVDRCVGAAVDSLAGSDPGMEIIHARIELKGTVSDADHTL